VEATSTPAGTARARVALTAVAALLLTGPAALAQDLPQTPPASPVSPAPSPALPAAGAGTTPAPAPAARTTPARAVRLRLGSRGALVRDLQRELRRRGARIRVDGAFGPGTRRAVRWMQRRLRLRVTGVADARLLARLGIQTLSAASGTGSAVGATLPAGVAMERWPTSGTFTSPFGPRWGRMHEGIDIANRRSGTPVVAPLAGTVVFAGWYGGYGNLVRIDHGGSVETRHGHLSSIAVQVGQVLATGDRIGGMGTTGSSTGVHLHFEVRVGGVAYDPLQALPPRPATVRPLTR
jgi:murein DD-endopeptidase MepM/ murein hydrolase activator NlpD